MSAAFFVLVFNRTIDAMLGFNLAMNGLMILVAFLVGRLVKNRGAGLLSALFVATFPPIVNLTRLARPQSVLPALVIVWLWSLLLMLQKRTVKTAWLFCFILLVGLWLHPNAFFLLLPATSLFIVYAIFSADNQDANPLSITNFSLKKFASRGWAKLKRPFVTKGLLPGLLMVALLASAWYLSALEDVTELAIESATNWSSERYGFTDIPATPFWYLWTFSGAISNFFAFLFWAGFIVYLFAKQRYPLILCLTFILMYFGMILRQGTLAWMNFAAVLPVVGVISAVFIVDLFAGDQNNALNMTPQLHSQRVIQIFASVLLGAAICISLFNVYVVTGELSENGELLAQTLGAPLDVACGWRMTVAYCPNPPRSQDWQELAILQTIINDEGCPNATCSVAVVTESAEIFSFISLRYFGEQKFPEATLEFLPIRRHGRYSLDWLTTDYIIYIPQLQNNLYANAVASFLQNPPDNFASTYEEVKQLSLPRGWNAYILRRAHPLTDEEIYAYLADVDLPTDFKASLTVDFTFRD
jgi:hypothetical protein